MAAPRPMSYKRPKDLRKTLRRLLGYLGQHKLSLAAVALMVVCSCMANILGTYLLRPVALAYTLSAIPAIGVVGIWWSVPIGWALADLIGFGYYRLRRREMEERLMGVEPDKNNFDK